MKKELDQQVNDALLSTDESKRQQLVQFYPDDASGTSGARAGFLYKEDSRLPQKREWLYVSGQSGR